MTADIWDKTKRSKVMSSIKSKNTKIELTIRKLIYSLGYRYRLHRADLPGKPDIVFKKRQKVIFVHGCFWHQHENCKISKKPKTNTDYWLPKLEKNKYRDIQNIDSLKHQGWEVMIIWECALKDINKLKESIVAFLGDTKTISKVK
jgi:DNA mismatch endonuclease (patch repair protein)